MCRFNGHFLGDLALANLAGYFAHGSGGEVLCWTHLCVCVCLSVREHISGTARTILTSFSVHVACGRRLVLRQDDKIPRGRGHFGGCPGHSKALAIFAAAVVTAFTAKGIIHSPITSCSRRVYSVCQASANRNPENSEHRWCGLSVGKGWWECTARAKSDIYDCLVVCWVPSFVWRRTFVDSRFLWAICPRIIQPTVSKHWRKLTLARESSSLASSILSWSLWEWTLLPLCRLSS